MLRHGEEETDSGKQKYMQLNFVLKNQDKMEKVRQETLAIMSPVFANYDHIDVQFPEYFEHDYTRKFKIIGEGDGLAEVVGGYYQRKAS